MNGIATIAVCPHGSDLQVTAPYRTAIETIVFRFPDGCRFTSSGVLAEDVPLKSSIFRRLPKRADFTPKG